MRKKIIILALALVLSSCGNNGAEVSDDKKDDELIEALSPEETKDTKEAEDTKDTEESAIESEIWEHSTENWAFGYLDTDRDEYIYDGKDVVIPYYIENAGDKEAESKLMFLVDGELQPFKINLSGKESETESVKTFQLKPKERQEFEVKFTPVTGKKGDKVGVIPALMQNGPSIVPSDKKIISFGGCYHLGTNITLPINMKKDGINKTKSSSVGYNLVEIPKSILDQFEGVEANDTYDILDSSPCIRIETQDTNKLLIKDNKLDLTINIYGGKQVTGKITLFIDNKPITIDKGDFIEVKTKKGKMCQIKTTIDASFVKKDSVMYGVFMTSGEDYKAQEIVATAPVLVKADR